MRNTLCKLALLILMVSVLLRTDITTAQEPPILHEVQLGENLFRIGLRYGVTLQELMQHNGITNPDLIFAGQILVIPPSDFPVPSFPNPQDFAQNEILTDSETITEMPVELIGIVNGYRPLLGSPEDNECNPGGTMAGHCINAELYICGWMMARYNRRIISLEQVLPETCRPPTLPQSGPEIIPGIICPVGSSDPFCN